MTWNDNEKVSFGKVTERLFGRHLAACWAPDHSANWWQCASGLQRGELKAPPASHKQLTRLPKTTGSTEIILLFCPWGSFFFPFPPSPPPPLFLPVLLYFTYLHRNEILHKLYAAPAPTLTSLRDRAACQSPNYLITVKDSSNTEFQKCLFLPRKYCFLGGKQIWDLYSFIKPRSQW